MEETGMIQRPGWIIALLVLSLVFAFGCSEKDFGKVDQGRVIEFDKDKWTITLIQDKKADPGKPDYSTLPPHTYALPKEPVEMGPEPKAGYRMKIDLQKKQIIIFDKAAQNLKTIDFNMIDNKEGIEKDNPLVFDKAANAAKKFPVVDREKKTITIYSGRQKTLTVISVPDEYFALPDKTWDAGDEVRVYYKEEGKALRFMNISKTDIFKK
jgi:hypothetical protein